MKKQIIVTFCVSPTSLQSTFMEAIAFGMLYLANLFIPVRACVTNSYSSMHANLFRLHCITVEALLKMLCVAGLARLDWKM